jgi:hypothetical protein
MADLTRRFKFTTLTQPADRVDMANYKFSDADRTLLDRLLRFAVENHVHTGVKVTTIATPPPTLTIAPTGGSIPGNAAVHYRYSIVDSRGQEALGSQVATIYTTGQASAPGFAPRLSPVTGTLDGGDYLYAVSACTNDSTQETLLGPTGVGTLPTFGGWYLDLPPLPSGSQFFNVYRKGPRDDELVYLKTLPPEARTTVDAGDQAVNRFRTSPRFNTTNMTNTVTVHLPNPLPSGSWTWKLYRTYDPGQWDNSLLDWIGPTGTYLDDGRATRAGFPPITSAAVGGAPKIDLGTDTEGVPPFTVADVANRIANFNSDRTAVGPSTWQWISEYHRAALVAMRATVGRNTPVTQDMTLSLERHTSGSWLPVTMPFDSDPIVAIIRAGETIGDTVLLSNWPAGPVARGDMLRMNVLQDGYGGNNDIHDLTLAVTLRVQDGVSDQSYQWETT